MASLFDISHMGEFLLEGPGVLMAVARLEGWISTRKGQKFLRRALALDPNNPNALSDLSWMATSVRHIHEAGKALSAALAVSPTNPVLNRAADSFILRIHRSVVPFSVIAEAFTAVMSRSLGRDLGLNFRMIFLSVWGMLWWIAVVGSVPVLLGLGPRTAMFMRAIPGIVGNCLIKFNRNTHQIVRQALYNGLYRCKKTPHHTL